MPIAADILQREAEKSPRRLGPPPGRRGDRRRRWRRPCRGSSTRGPGPTPTSRDVLPDLEKSLKEIRELFNQRRSRAWTHCTSSTCSGSCLTARDGCLDAQFEVRQAVADLAAALGDPSVAVGPCARPVIAFRAATIGRCSPEAFTVAADEATVSPDSSALECSLADLSPRPRLLAAELREQAAGRNDAGRPGAVGAGPEASSWKNGSEVGRRHAAAARRRRPRHRPHRRPRSMLPVVKNAEGKVVKPAARRR